MIIKKAIIPAAGLGTRFLPATKALPKEMLPIVDKPVIQFIVEEAVASGIEEILIITGRSKRAIEDHFDKSYELEDILEKRGKDRTLEKVKQISKLANVHYIRQKEPKGLGDAVLQAEAFIGSEPFALLLGDDIVENDPETAPCTKQLIHQFRKFGRSVIGVQTVPLHQVDKYGIVCGNRESIQPGEIASITQLIEKPTPSQTPSRIAIMGRYILQPDIFSFLKKVSSGANGELQLTDALQSYNQYCPMLAYGFYGTRYDVGDPMGFLHANLSFAMKNPAYEPMLRTILEDMIENKSPVSKEPLQEVSR